MILHFVPDEKITDQIIENFLEISDQNYFIVFCVNDNFEVNHITKTGSFIGFFNPKDDINELIESIRAKAIIVHFLKFDYAKVILEITNSDIRIAWVVWGNDIYGFPKIRPKLYGPNTKLFLYKSKPALYFEYLIKKSNFLRKLYFEHLLQKDDYFRLIFKAINRINYFVSYIEEDYNIFQTYYPNKLQFINSTFSTIDQYLAGKREISLLANSNNILIGNSNSVESNYFDAIPLVAKKLNQTNKVYLVLSYGGNDKHKREVIALGKKFLKSNFYPLTEFIGREQYIEILQTCSVGIFNHYRQQAMGNIIAMLYMGARVYLSSRNPAFHFFKLNGISVNSLERDFFTYGTSRNPEKVIQQNRKQLDSIFNKEKVLADLSNLRQIIISP